MYSTKNLKNLYLAKNIEELQKQAETIQLVINDSSICNKLLKIYDQALKLLNLENEEANIQDIEIDEERSYIYLWRFVDLSIKVRNSKIYKNDPVYFDSLLSINKIKKAIKLLEVIKTNLKKRYNQNEEEPTVDVDNNVNNEVKPASKSEPLDDEIEQIIGKLFITPKEFSKLIEKSKFKFLIIDCRSKSEFNFEHLDLSYLIKSNERKSDIDYFNLNSDYIKPGLVIWKLEEYLRQDNNFEFLECVCKRSNYDYFIIFDKKSKKSDLNATDNKLSIVKRMFYEFDLDENKIKHEPIILDGGWLDWIFFYPAYTKRNNIDSNTKLNEKKEDNLEKNIEKKDNFMFSVDYPNINEVEEKNDDKQVDSEVNMNDIEDQESVPVKPIPSIDRKTKPNSVKVNNSQSNLTSQSTVPDSQQALNRKQSDQSLLFTQSQLQSTTITPATSIKPTITTSSISVPSSTPIIPPSSSQPMLIQRPNVFLNTVYKPFNENIFFFKPFRTSNLNGGMVKYLNPITGTLQYVYDEGNKKEYTPNDTLPQTLLNAARKFPKPILKSELSERKMVISGNENTNNSSLRRTSSSPDIAKSEEEEESETEIITSDEDNTTKLDIKQPIAPTTAISTTPATINTANTFKTPPNTNTATNITPVNTITDAILNPSKSTTLDAPKPNINRNNKPMPENIKRIRFENLEPQWSSVQPGLTGIRNLGNTCFMNSIIQCLSNTKQLKDYFINGTYRNDLNRTNPLGFSGEIADEFSIIVHALWLGNCKTIAPKHFKNIIGQFNSQFIANEQQDAQEFLLFLLDGLHEDLNKVIKRPRNLPEIDYDKLDDFEGAKAAWEHHRKLNNSIIVDLFQGLFKSTVACLTCGKQSIKFDAFMYLTLPILSSRCSLYDCLTLFLKPEKMSGESRWKCPQCKTLQEAAKKIDIWSLPRLLIIHLKRFKYQGVWRDKIKTTVDYPIDNLDLQKFLRNTDNKTSYTYKLYAISNHTGTLDGGHYTALCKNEKINRWFKFDDSTVNETDLESIKSASSSYILFYSLT